MTAQTVRIDEFFDADEYFRSGNWPWTFFSFPTAAADGDGLPPDRIARDVLRLVQQRLPVALWQTEVIPGATFFVCRIEDSGKLSEVLDELMDSGVMGADYLRRRAEQLFAAIEDPLN